MATGHSRSRALRSLLGGGDPGTRDPDLQRPGHRPRRSDRHDTATVSVAWAFDGFGPPLDSSGGINAANAGSTIPVKFSLDGNQGLAIFKAGYPASASYDCGSTPPTDVERSRGLERLAQLCQGGGVDPQSYEADAG